MHSGPQNRAPRYLRLLSGRWDVRLDYDKALSYLLYPSRFVSNLGLRRQTSVIVFPR